MTKEIKKTNILSCTQDELKIAFEKAGLKPFIAKQVQDWVYKKYKSTFEEMNNISKQNQQILNENFEIKFYSNYLEIPASDGTAIKYVITLLDGNMVEMVVLNEKTYTTLCVSSQCGCPVDCKFCLTGVVGFKRQLKVEEVVGQIFLANTLGHNISNLVFMGMGEPMLNFDVVFKAINLMNQDYSFNISKRKITVSTSGYLQGIKRLIKDEEFINLAFSVGNADPLKRVKIMPITAKNPFIEVVEAIKEYQSMHNRQLTLEYTFLKDQNDDPQAIRDLINVAKYLNGKVNLINLNPHEKIPFKPIPTKLLLSIRDQIKREGLPVTVRYKKGQDVSAACGQLGESYLPKK